MRPTGRLFLSLVAERVGDTWSAPTPGPGLPDGAYTARALQVDDAGNRGESALTYFTVRVPAAGTPGRATASRDPAKLSVSQARVLRQRRVLDVVAPISRRASGNVRVSFQSAGRSTGFTQRIDAANGLLRISRALPAAQAAAGTGILTLRYPGNARTRPQEVRLRAAANPARLTVRRPLLVDDRLSVEGTAAPRARGAVRVQLDWQAGGVPRTLELTAPIAEGEFRLATELATDVAASIAARQGSLHAYVLYTGYRQARIRGEMRSLQVLGPR